MFFHPLIANVRPSEFFWEGECVLPSWRGFRKCDAFNQLLPGAAMSGLFPILIDYPGDVNEALPSPVQLEAIDFLTDQETQIFSGIFDKLISYYNDKMEALGEPFHRIREATQFKSLVGVNAIHIPDGELPYIGFELGALWNEEEGLGIMTCQGLVLDIGSAETGFELPETNI